MSVRRFPIATILITQTTTKFFTYCDNSRFLSDVLLVRLTKFARFRFDDDDDDADDDDQ